MDGSWEERIGAALHRARKIVVLGVGNPDKGDDGAGPRCADRLKRRLEAPAGAGVLVVDARDVPENHTGTIRRFGPDLTLIIDAAVGGHAPGTIFIVDQDKIADDGLSTHRASLRYLVRYLKETIGGEVLILGIQPENIDLGVGRNALSKPVERSAKEIADFLSKNLMPRESLFPA